jgi:hypothetical protein
MWTVGYFWISWLKSQIFPTDVHTALPKTGGWWGGGETFTDLAPGLEKIKPATWIFVDLDVEGGTFTLSM